MARILVVEDDAALSHVLRMVLENEGHEVLAADDGLRAMATAQRRHPDLIICDLMMPTMDGFTFLEALREDERTRDTSVLVLTALDKEIVEERCYRLGVKVFLRKPFDAAILLGMVEELLEDRDSMRMRERFGISTGAPLVE